MSRPPPPRCCNKRRKQHPSRQDWSASIHQRSTMRDPEPVQTHTAWVLELLLRLTARYASCQPYIARFAVWPHKLRQDAITGGVDHAIMVARDHRKHDGEVILQVPDGPRLVGPPLSRYSQQCRAARIAANRRESLFFRWAPTLLFLLHIVWPSTSLFALRLTLAQPNGK